MFAFFTPANPAAALGDSEQKISSINDFIESEFEHLKNQTNLQPSLPNEDDKLDELFREELIEVGK